MRQCKPASYGTIGSKDEKSESHSLVVWIREGWNKMTLMTLLSDSEIVVALVSAFVTGILALRLGKELYR